MWLWEVKQEGAQDPSPKSTGCYECGDSSLSSQEWPYSPCENSTGLAKATSARSPSLTRREQIPF